MVRRAGWILTEPFEKLGLGRIDTARGVNGVHGSVASPDEQQASIGGERSQKGESIPG